MHVLIPIMAMHPVISSASRVMPTFDKMGNTPPSLEFLSTCHSYIGWFSGGRCLRGCQGRSSSRVSHRQQCCSWDTFSQGGSLHETRWILGDIIVWKWSTRMRLCSMAWKSQCRQQPVSRERASMHAWLVASQILKIMQQYNAIPIPISAKELNSPAPPVRRMFCGT